MVPMMVASVGPGKEEEEAQDEDDDGVEFCCNCGYAESGDICIVMMIVMLSR